MAFKCDFTMFSILSNSLKLRLREHIEWQARVDRMTLVVGCVDRIIVVDRIDVYTNHHPRKIN